MFFYVGIRDIVPLLDFLPPAQPPCRCYYRYKVADYALLIRMSHHPSLPLALAPASLPAGLVHPG
jgi:hypothetical protein